MNDYRNRKYFFDGGLHFECTRCGHCCTGSPGDVRVTHEEIVAMARETGHSVGHFILEYCKPLDHGLGLKETTDGNCVLFKNGCSVYAVRPSQCRTFPFWFKNLRSEEVWSKTAAACPGIGKGRLHSKEEILTLLNAP